MPQINLRYLSLFLLVTLLTACSGSSDSDLDGGEEKLPGVDKSEFYSVERKGFECKLYEKMSLNHTEGREIISANYLPLEYHLSVESYSLKFLRGEGEFPKNEAKQLEWFAEYHSHQLEMRLMSMQVEAPEKVTVNGQPCFKKHVSGRSFGFPKDKYFYIRYYRFEDTFIAIVGWTVKENVEKFKPLIKYMGMTFAPKSNEES